jgi:protein-S-isoprenylcysteine O-methyltransferase Ste14
LAFRFLKLSTISYLFLTRVQPRVEDNRFGRLISYISTVLPLFYREQSQHILDTPLFFLVSILFVFGEIISIWGLISLGKSFGVSPAKRIFVEEGPYKFLKHPIYFGYAISEFAICVAHSTRMNLLILPISLSLYFVRAVRENRILKQ